MLVLTNHVVTFQVSNQLLFNERFHHFANHGCEGESLLTMESRDAEKLRKNRVKIVESVDARKLTDVLFQEGILVNEDLEIINSKVTSAERARTLLDILPTRGPRAFKVFIDALSRDSAYPWLAAELR